MLIDTGSLNSVALQSDPNRVIVVVKVRSWEKNEDEFPWGASNIHGEEGVWYQPEGKNIVRLDPMEKEDDYRLYFELILDSKNIDTNIVIHHRWLVRYWDQDVYFPTIQSFQIVAFGILQEDKTVFWTISWGNVTIEGVEL